nr:MAG: hypothetical protein [Gammatorquevirus sp.]
MSPTTLRAKFMPRNPRRERKPNIQAHPAAAAAAACHQVQPPPTLNCFEENTATNATPYRNFRINRRFKPGFETQTEKELSIAFCRPPRTFVNDPPFYPWLPIAPKVSFALNFKF